MAEKESFDNEIDAGLRHAYATHVTEDAAAAELWEEVREIRRRRGRRRRIWNDDRVATAD